MRIKKIITNKYFIILFIILFIGLINLLTNNNTWINIFLLLFLIFILPIVQIIRNRNSLIPLVRDFEFKLFGKPLEKGLWKKGELKNVKTKIIWKRKKKGVKK